MSRRVLSKEEFMRRALADLDAENKLVTLPVVQEVPKKLKRKCTYRRKRYTDFDVIEKTVLYA